MVMGLRIVVRVKSIFRLLFCARYNDFIYATKRADMQEKNLVATKSSSWKYTKNHGGNNLVESVTISNWNH